MLPLYLTHADLIGETSLLYRSSDASFQKTASLTASLAMSPVIGTFVRSHYSLNASLKWSEDEGLKAVLSFRLESNQ